MTTSNFIQRYQASGTKIMSIVLAVVLVSQLVLSTLAQAAKPVDAGPSASGDLDQCANGSLASPSACNWQNGSLQSNNSHYAENQSVPYRIVMEDLDTSSVHTLVLEYDIKHSSKHALDYLTSFDRTETTADPCDGVTGCAFSGTAAFPAPSSTGSPVSGQPTTSFNAHPSGERALSMYNAAIAGTGITYVSQGSLTAASASTQIQIQFTASQATAVFAWGGHIATPNVWGAGNSAGGISGSPYHMRFISLDGSGGNQDRSLSADAVTATPAPGTLTVIKNVINDDGGTAVASDFTMNVTGTNVSTSSFPGSSVGTSVTLDAGSYSVTEGAATGYAASYSADCSGTIAAGEAKTCTITNDDEEQAPTTGTLTVEKTIVNDDGGLATLANFSFYIYEAPGQVVDTQSGVLVQEGAQNTLPPGTYWVSESGSGGYYQATFSGACDGSPFVTLAAGQDLTCTITNDDQPATITVTKAVVGGNAQVSDFPLFVGQTSVTSGASTVIDAGTYTVSETNNQANYTATFSGDCDPQGGITLLPGDQKSCTITNTYDAPPVQTGTITVVKVVSGGNAQVSDFPLFIGATSVTSGVAETLPVGTYTVSETNNQANYSASFSGACDQNGSVTLSVDQDLTCTITNTYVPPAPTTGDVTVTKIVINDDETASSQVSDFDLFVGATQVTSGATNAFTAGDYVVSETGPSGYQASFGGDCDENGNLTVVAGQSYECTITNDDNEPVIEEPTQGTLTVVKVVINNDGGTAQVSSFPLFIGQTQVTSGSTTSLPAGQYVVSETSSPDYVSSISGDCDVNGVVNIEDGDTKTCTITNDDKAPTPPGGSGPQNGTLIVVTVVNNDGGGEALPASFTMTVGDGVSVSSTFGGTPTPGFSMAYAPGAYVVNGTTLPNYSQSKSANCAGTMLAGQTVTCVVTYTYQAAPTGGSPTPPTPPAPPAPPVPQVLGVTDSATGPVPQVLGATDSDLPVTGMPAWTLATLLLAAAPFLRRKRA